jgi:hypothetical protein
MMRPRAILSHIAVFLSGIFIALILSNTANLASTIANADNNRQNDYYNALYSSSRIRQHEAIANDNSTERSSSVRGRPDREEQDYDFETDANNRRTKTAVGNVDSGLLLGLRDRLLQSHLNSIYNNKDEDNNNNAASTNNDICTLLPQPTPTTLSLWSSHLPQILNATQHAADQTFQFHDFTAQLLNILSPDRLQRSVKTLPLDWTSVERCLDIIYARLLAVQADVDTYIQSNKNKDDKLPLPLPPLEVMKTINNDNKHPRKLNVLVMGGSVTMGVVCHINPVTTQTGKYSRRDCAWPGRLSTFFTNLFGGYELISFHTVALGGTNTESGSIIWDYTLLPDNVPYPDVIINAYATNDMHYNSVQDALAKNVSLANNLLNLGQEFIRQVLTPKWSDDDGCNSRPPPLLLFLDDYLGNEQNEILTTILSSQTIHLLSNYYGIGSISYADAVRDIVYGDTREWWFSSNWYEQKSDTYIRAVHPNMGMHISMVWIVAYNLLNLVTIYCSLPIISTTSTTNNDKWKHQQHQRPRRWRRHHAGIERTSNGVWDYGYTNRSLLIDVPLQYTKELVGGPKQKPLCLPPPLTPDLSLEHITELWKDEYDRDVKLWSTYEECIAPGVVTDASDNIDIPKPCIYSWVAKLERKLDNPARLTDRIAKYLTSNEGWSAMDDNNKLGWVPTSGLGSKFTMEFKKIVQPVRAVTWMIMRSYGEKWDGSMLSVEVWSNEILLAKQDIEGYHDKKTSETYNIKMRLDGEGRGAGVGSDLQINFTLIGGTTFKISGMAICDH